MYESVQVLDETAFALCKDNLIPVLVFDLHKPGNILRAIQGMPSLGTVVDAEPDKPSDLCCASGRQPAHEQQQVAQQYSAHNSAHNGRDGAAQQSGYEQRWAKELAQPASIEQDAEAEQRRWYEEQARYMRGWQRTWEHRAASPQQEQHEEPAILR